MILVKSIIMENEKKIDDKLNDFLDIKKQEDDVQQEEKQQIIKGDRSLVERINKKVITEDGRQLLI